MACAMSVSPKQHKPLKTKGLCEVMRLVAIPGRNH